MENEHPLFTILNKEYPGQVERVLEQGRVDIDPTFMGFTDVYESLAKIIPEHWGVVDIGCAYAAQGYYFRNHRVYLGCDIGLDVERFHFMNTFFHIDRSIEEICYECGLRDLNTTFCILNYVPLSSGDQKLIRQTFPNLFCYYPCGE